MEITAFGSPIGSPTDAVNLASYKNHPKILAVFTFKVFTVNVYPFHPKEWGIGVEINGVTKAYPFSMLYQAVSGDAYNAHGEFLNQIGGQSIPIVFDAANRSGRVYFGGGQADTLLPSTTGYWFAWHAFYPESLVYTPNTQTGKTPP
ncbi:MAG: DUF3179 domain-containing protein [Ectothiorhodospiraceae bacterium]|nr:DUF3179 domain-containing protein [Ectothiorhodospiraceae bacterium]